MIWIQEKDHDLRPMVESYGFGVWVHFEEALDFVECIATSVKVFKNFSISTSEWMKFHINTLLTIKLNQKIRLYDHRVKHPGKD